MLHQLWSSPGVRRFLWDDEIIPFERTQAAVAESERLFHERGYGLWGAWSNDAPTLVGFAGLWPFRDPPEVELLYGVAEGCWGRGYAAEIGSAVMTYCILILGMPAIRASTDVGNVASIRVLEKLGFTLTRRAWVGGLETVFYEVQQDAVRRCSAAGGAVK
jgi:ribosomal-protein-alanine N-acetyltransferase